ncbi:DUF1573 domain-containing protein [Rufibacter sp. LB8]|nr:DUF1573 domain-containing protein [Rufibacter sp. LB8]
MKTLSLCAAFLVFGTAAAFAQTAPDSLATPAVVAPKVVEGPSIQLEEEKFDFGNIKQGDVVEHTFTFTNNGSQPLVIKNVRTTCGCTATDYPKTAIQPGQTASLTARFNSAGKKGPQNKVITIDSNAVQGSAQVFIKTNILTTVN